VILRVVSAFLCLFLLSSAALGESFKKAAAEMIEKEEGAPVKIMDFYASFRGFSPDREYHILSFYSNPWGKSSFLVEKGGKRFWVRVDYLVKRRVAVARCEIPRGTVVCSQDVAERVMWLSPKNASDAVDLSEAVGKVVKKSIRRGEVLSAKYLAEPLLIKRGELVKVLLKSGSIEIEAVAKAMRNGKLGETVLLKNISSGRVFSGVVVGPKEVVVR